MKHRKIASSPVAAAVFKAKLRKAHNRLAIRMYLTETGEDATDILSDLGMLLGTVTEAAAQQFGRELHWVRHLHGALRTVQSLCLNGYKWDANLAKALDVAAGVASAQVDKLNTASMLVGWSAATNFSDAILAHKIDKDSIQT